MSLPTVEVHRLKEVGLQTQRWALEHTRLPEPVGPVITLHLATAGIFSFDRDTAECLALRKPTEDEMHVLRVYVMLNHPEVKTIRIYAEGVK